ncbi:MAG TPA: potassium channel family protein [Pirellulales bacterium]|jgi:hypothetical protein|nr:potassium channel family protein [Pirellulales bacterium]
MIAAVEFFLGILIWGAVLWDGFATIVLPRTVTPSRRLSGRFNRWSWWLWSRAARRIKQDDLRLSFLSVYGPISVMLLLILWAGLMIVAFALIYQTMGQRFQASVGPADFGTLLYMSGSTFLTLGIGDVTSADPIGRLFMILEASSGLIFLGLVITYMPLLHQAYAAREVYNLLIHSRLRGSPVAIQLLHRYSGPDRAEILRGHLRDAEHWMAETLQSHLAHPVLSFYRAQHWGESWLVSVATIMDTCTLVIVGGEGLPAAQARLTYQMGVRLLTDLTHALAIRIDHDCPTRVSEADIPVIAAAMQAAGLNLRLEQMRTLELLRLSREYEIYLIALSHWLMFPLTGWLPPKPAGQVT